MNDTTITYRSAREAAKVWGAQNGIVGRKGGYLNATSVEAYRALPLVLRFRKEADLSLVQDSTSGKGRKIQGWDDLADILRRRANIVAVPASNSLGRTRYALVQF